MSQTHDCQCQDDITMIPIHGLQIGIQSDLLKKCDCDGSGGGTGGRTRVTEDLHIYIDGKRTESGNGLTPETAVASYEDAVDVASHYDGCNKWNVYFHFADIATGEMYPAIVVAGVDHATFSSVRIRGESYLTTKFTKITFLKNCIADIKEVYTFGVFVDTLSNLLVIGAISLHGYSYQNTNFGLIVSNGSICYLLPESEIYIKGGNYHAVFHANAHSTLSFAGKIIVVNPVTVSWGFVIAQAGFLWAHTAIFITQAAVTGVRYFAHYSGTIYTGSKGANFFPGTVAGSVSTGGVYV